MNAFTELTAHAADYAVVGAEKVGTSTVVYLGDGASLRFNHDPDDHGAVGRHVKALLRALSQVEINDQEAHGVPSPVVSLRRRPVFGGEPGGVA